MTELTHLNKHGQAYMVDVSEKSETLRMAKAAATIHVSEVAMTTLLEGEVKKTELELLEERDENELSEEEEDRMYELRRLRAQKNMNNEVRETEEAELKKADEEIAHLKTLLKPKPKKLPKGYIA